MRCGAVRCGWVGGWMRAGRPRACAPRVLSCTYGNRPAFNGHNFQTSIRPTCLPEAREGDGGEGGGRVGQQGQHQEVYCV